MSGSSPGERLQDVALSCLMVVLGAHYDEGGLLGGSKATADSDVR